MTAEQKNKFEQEVQAGIAPTMGNMNVMIEVVSNILGGYVTQAVNINWTKVGGVLTIEHPWGKVFIQDDKTATFQWHA